MTETNPQQTQTDKVRASDPLRERHRIRFAKTDLLRWISHRDLARLWERLLRRAELKLSMTEGFHPKPRVSFPSALALGVEGLDEVVEIELAEHWSADDLLARLRRDDQPGLSIISVETLSAGDRKARLQCSQYEISVPDDADPGSIHRAIDQVRARQSVTVHRKKKPTTVQIDEQILDLELIDRTLHLRLAASDAASLRPTEVLELLGFDDWIENGSLIRRVRVVLQNELKQPSDRPRCVVATAAEEPTEQDKNRTPA